MAGRAGSLLLFSETAVEVRPWAIAVVVGVAIVAVVLVFMLLVVLVVRAQRLPVNTGREGMIGQTAVARSALDPRGTVFVEGEIWNASLEDGRADPGEEVRIVAIEGLLLKVVKKSD